ncbi:hypothetical protein VTL71DRAFT_7932 [Oculimacula yallundae]|uniref:Essential MCU regulator, mitochondrial n=1 Tax=Oculimacula yallundae TaxID=86028 RepID=A0ABR4CW44_9HELO
MEQITTKLTTIINFLLRRQSSITVVVPGPVAVAGRGSFDSGVSMGPHVPPGGWHNRILFVLANSAPWQRMVALLCFGVSVSVGLIIFVAENEEDEDKNEDEEML